MNKAQWTSKIKAAFKAGKEEDEDFCMANAIQEVAKENLVSADYKAWWAGENGSDSYPTRSVKALISAGEALIEKEDPTKNMDFQIWEEGSVFVGYYNNVALA